MANNGGWAQVHAVVMLAVVVTMRTRWLGCTRFRDGLLWTSLALGRYMRKTSMSTVMT